MLFLLSKLPCHLRHIHARMLLTSGQFTPHPQIPVEVFQMFPISIITGMGHQYLVIFQPLILSLPWIFITKVGSTIPCPFLQQEAAVLMELINLQFRQSHRGWAGAILMYQDQAPMCIHLLLVTTILVLGQGAQYPQLFPHTQGVVPELETGFRHSRHTTSNNLATHQQCVALSFLGPVDLTTTGTTWLRSGQWPHPRVELVVPSTSSPQVHQVETFKNRIFQCQLASGVGKEITSIPFRRACQTEIQRGVHSTKLLLGLIPAFGLVATGRGMVLRGHHNTGHKHLIFYLKL